MSDPYSYSSHGGYTFREHAPPGQYNDHCDPSAGARRAVDALRATLTAPTLSRDAVRNAAVRYGAAARDAAASPREMADTLTADTERALATLPAALGAELRAHVAWWAAHGYHRAD